MNVLLSDYCMRHGISPDALIAGGVTLGDKDMMPLARRLNVIVPVSFAQTGEYMVASCYACLRDAVSSFFARYQDCFSMEALDDLHRLLLPYLTEWGYRPNPFPFRYADSCVMDDLRAMPHGGVLTNPAAHRLLQDALPEKSLVSMHLRDCAARGAYVVTSPDSGAVCAIAAVNRCTEAAAEKTGDARRPCVEIGVECAPAYRRRGYALSCVLALARELIMDGNTVLYQYYRTNSASAALAQKAGFRFGGRFFTYSSFRA